MAANEKNGGELSSWKEISEFLGVSERTAQKWEADRGLPVERLPGPKGRVVAKVAALENWKRSNIRRTPWHANVRVLRFYAAALTAALLMVLGVVLIRYLRDHKAGPPTRYRVDFNTLIVENAKGEEIWRHVFETPMDVSYYASQTIATSPRLTWFGKLGSEQSGTSMLFAYIPVTLRSTGTSLVCFSEKGKKEWEFKPGRLISDAKTTFQPAFTILSVQVAALAGNDSSKKILVISHHYREYPSQFAILDANGHRESEYWHSGFLTHVETADLNKDGIQEILIGGIDNGRKAATLLVFDPRRVGGASEQPPGDDHQLSGLGAGTEICKILFPKTCLSEEFNYLAGLVIGKDSVTVETSQKENDFGLTVLYQFDYSLNLKSATPSTHMLNLHHDLYVKRELNHEWSPQEEARLYALNWVKGHPGPWPSIGTP